ncbi:MAG: M20/M25/M40 family metallo-hydrolase [Clostridiales bacterium]|nr:M20/M25/M40 family metallo-hydrolase [Clostridiales bacterium]
MFFAVILLFTAAIIFGAACINAIRMKRKNPPFAAYKGDDAVNAKYAKDLSKMIQVPTINDGSIDPYEIHSNFNKFHELLKALFPLCHSEMERVDLQTDALLFRLKGADSSKGAIVLMAHQDVVPADGLWKHDPFSGDIDDSRVWGRGAVDTKGSLCAIFEALESLIAEGFTPSRDIYISSSNNEETMGDGAARAVNYFKKNGIPVEIVSDEGGAIIESPMPGLSGHYAMLGIVEKGIANVKFTARSSGGHASAPPKNSPIAKLSAFVSDIDKRPPFESKLSEPLCQMFEALAPSMSFPYRFLFGNLWLFGPIIKLAMPAISSQANAMLRTTCAFTMAQGSKAANVMPETASVTANVRFIMHQPREESLDLLKEASVKHGLEMEVLYSHDCSPYVDIGSSQYQYVEDCLSKTFPNAGIAPYIMIGGTDSRHFSEICKCVVRCSPIIMDSQQLNSMHAADENVYIDSIAQAVDFYRLMIKEA